MKCEWMCAHVCGASARYVQVFISGACIMQCFSLIGNGEIGGERIS